MYAAVQRVGNKPFDRIFMKGAFKNPIDKACQIFNTGVYCCK